MRDFEVYWTAASRALHAAPLYRADDGHFQFKYLPAFAVLTTPLALAPLPSAKTVWVVLSAGLIVALIGLSIRLLPALRQRRWVIVVAILVSMGKFYGHEVTLGQVNLLFAVLVVLAALALQNGREATGAALIVLAVVV